MRHTRSPNINDQVIIIVIEVITLKALLIILCPFSRVIGLLSVVVVVVDVMLRGIFGRK